MPPLMRRIFWIVNKFFMVPLFRIGFGPFFVNPLTGYIMVLKLIGRKTGKVHYAPVNYAIHKGDIYCVSGGRQTSDWYRNLLATPDVEIILPSGPLYARAEEISEPNVRRALIRQIFKNAGFAGFFEGYNPYTITDDELMQKSGDMPLLRLHPLGIANGASDPGGWAWVWLFVFFIILVIVKP
jgi:deazaflavin-dependent oxidoreductase (nitroreductase family)